MRSQSPAHKRVLAGASAVLLLIAVSPPPTAALGDTTLTPAGLTALCDSLFGATFPSASLEPLAACQWNMSLIDADAGARAKATGAGVRVGVLDFGVDLTHPDIAPNLDLASSCSFIAADDPVALPTERANGDCSNKAAIQDFDGHGTHVASLIAAPINGIGIAGVAPEATLVAIKVCAGFFCFPDAVAAGLRYAGDLRLDVVNLSLFADPFLFFCGNDSEQGAMLRDLQAAAKYAQQRGVLIVASAGNQALDLRHPPDVDTISPDFPPDAAVERAIGNQCRVVPAELPGVVSVSATGPIGIPGYTLNIATYSSVGADVAAPGGNSFIATGTVQDGVLGAITSTSESGRWDVLAARPFPGGTTIDGGGRYAYLNGTSMSSPHVAGVAALLIDRHPDWGPGAVRAALLATSTHLDCPPDWEPLNATDERDRCLGGNGTTSFFGHGLVNATSAASR